jgi:hypothetical protein
LTLSNQFLLMERPLIVESYHNLTFLLFAYSIVTPFFFVTI